MAYLAKSKGVLEVEQVLITEKLLDTALEAIKCAKGLPR